MVTATRQILGLSQIPVRERGPAREGLTRLGVPYPRWQNRPSPNPPSPAAALSPAPWALRPAGRSPAGPGAARPPWHDRRRAASTAGCGDSFPLGRPGLGAGAAPSLSGPPAPQGDARLDSLLLPSLWRKWPIRAARHWRAGRGGWGTSRPVVPQQSLGAVNQSLLASSRWSTGRNTHPAPGRRFPTPRGVYFSPVQPRAGFPVGPLARRGWGTSGLPSEVSEVMTGCVDKRCRSLLFAAGDSAGDTQYMTAAK